MIRKQMMCGHLVSHSSRLVISLILTSTTFLLQLKTVQRTPSHPDATQSYGSCVVTPFGAGSLCISGKTDFQSL